MDVQATPTRPQLTSLSEPKVQILYHPPEKPSEIRYDRIILNLHISPASMTNLLSVIHSDTDILGGTPVFIGTRVPVKALLDYLAAGDPLDEFLAHFPSVKKEQAIAVINAKSLLFRQI